MGSVQEVSRFLLEWEQADSAGGDVTSIITKLVEVFELETEAFLKQDPDPFDDRHPSRSVPDCSLGHILKVVFKNQRIVDQMIKVYTQLDAVELNTVVCRFLIALLPGLGNIIFQEDGFILRLFQWAENAPDPLQSYATGLLAAAMSVPENVSSYIEKNFNLVPVMLKRLYELSKIFLLDGNCDEGLLNRYSNSNKIQFTFGSYQVFPLTSATQQKHILKYLTPLGEYQDLIGYVYELNVLPLILRYIDLRQNRDVRLAFEALKYLSSLFCHKKIAIEFLNIGGLQLLLKVPRPSVAATGVSICLYHLGHLEEAMEKICMSPSFLLSNLVSYALWFLESSYTYSRYHATIFFGFGFTFKVILEHFDHQDGLRKLFNVMSTLDIFVSQNARILSDDDVFANRLTTKYVCGSLKRYFEANLAALVEDKRLLCQTDNDLRLNCKTSRAASLTPEAVDRNMKVLHDLSLLPLSQWKPVNEFVNLYGVNFLIHLVSSYLKSSYNDRDEIVRHALDVLKICSLTVSTELKFCEKLSSPDYPHVNGMNIILQAAEGKLMPVAEVQHSALLTIINCVCTKIPSIESSSRNISTPKHKTNRQVQDLLYKIWKSVRIKNGIIVLINLLSVKNPLTDADAIRALACKALCGLGRSETVKQIISKLPLITCGKLIDLMKEPILQDKYDEHVQFCKYGLELIERVTGAPLAVGSQYFMNLNKMFVSEVVAKTKVVYNEDQLLQLMCAHLSQKGFTRTVLCLQREMKNKSVATKSPFCLGAFPSVNDISWNIPSKPFHGVKKSNTFNNSSSKVSISISFIPPPSVPLKIVRNKKILTWHIKPPPCRLQKPQVCSGSYDQSPAFVKMRGKNAVFSYKDTPPAITLDSIVTEYLRKQHSWCKNPMLACPSFDLVASHKCPEPHFEKKSPINCVLGTQKREIGFQNRGYRGLAINAKHIYSRFRLHSICRDRNRRCDFTTCAFLNNNEPYPKIIIGTYSGRIKVFNVNTAKEILSRNCHYRAISHIESKKSTTHLIISEGGRVGNSSIWNFTSGMDFIHNFSRVTHMEFGKLNVDRVIGTKKDAAVIYDVNTFAELQSFPVEDLGNSYFKNIATFDFLDELVLSDGLLYDVRSGKMLHKLDKFSSNMNGVFHPNGREIICNSEIWDIRTFKLLHTVAGLDQCRVTFNQSGSVIYAVSFNKDLDTTKNMNCFYTFDAINYNTLAAINVKRPVYQLDCDMYDRFVGTIDRLSDLESVCRLYEVGRTKQVGDASEDSKAEMDERDEIEDETTARNRIGRFIPMTDSSESSDSSDDDESLLLLHRFIEDF